MKTKRTHRIRGKYRNLAHKNFMAGKAGPMEDRRREDSSKVIIEKALVEMES